MEKDNRLIAVGLNGIKKDLPNNITPEIIEKLTKQMSSKRYHKLVKAIEEIDGFVSDLWHFNGTM